MDMTREIRIEEGKLKVVFEIQENGVVELKQFDSAGRMDVKERDRGEEDFYPITEVQITGRGTRGMHAYKHNVSGGATDFVYQSHEVLENEKGKELIIHTATEYGVKGEYHMQFYPNVAAVQVWTILKNEGTEEIGLEYVSSFIYQGLCQSGEKPYFEKTSIYTPHNSWDCESQWRKNDCREINLSGMAVNGFNTPGFGMNRYCYGGHSSWSTCEYLPMGICEDEECKVTYFFQVEHSGQWLIEYGPSTGERLYVALSGATETEHGWWKNLKPGDTFTTVPAGFGVADGDVNEAMAELTEYRRKIRRPNEDDEKLNQIVCTYLNDSGFQAKGCLSAAAAYEEMYHTVYQLIISDIMMPEIDGFEFAGTVRRINETIPILFMSAKDDLPSKRKGFQLGIDDYMVKPIELDELLLRVRALLRRANIEMERKITVGNLILDADAMSAEIDGEEISLTTREFNIIYKLLSYPKKTFSRAQLMDEFWGVETDTSLRAVDVYVTKLRDKLSACDGFKIVTVRGLGYKVVLQ